VSGGVRRGAVFVLFVAFAGLAVGCGDDGGGDAAGATSTSAPTTTAAEATTTGEATTTTAQACPPVPPLPGDVESVRGDVDGDGLDDAVAIAAQDDGPHLVVALAAGGGGELVLDAGADPLGDAAVNGIADVNGDGAGEIWATVGSGASTRLHGLFRLDGCAPAAVRLDGAPAVFAVGGSVGATGGVRCDDIDGNGALDEVVVLAAQSSDGQTYDTTTTGYVLGPDGTLSQVTQQPGQVAAGDPEFAAFTTFRCGDLTD
jgi:hypothetical protein